MGAWSFIRKWLGFDPAMEYRPRVRQELDMRQLVVGFGWSAASGLHPGDVDLVALGLQADGRLCSSQWCIDLDRSESPNGAVWFLGPDRVKHDRDEQRLVIDTASVPAHITSILIYVRIHDLEVKDLSYMNDEASYVRILDEVSGTELIHYTNQELAKYPVLLIAELYRNGGEWFVRALTKGVSRQELVDGYISPPLVN